jgi:carboxypeptidase C (cathepsin A)
VDSYSKKTETERAAENVAAIKAVVEKIELKLVSVLGKKDNNKLAISILNAFRWNWQIPDDKITIAVEKGCVTLEDELQWNYQMEVTKEMVKNMVNITGITNDI